MGRLEAGRGVSWAKSPFVGREPPKKRVGIHPHYWVRRLKRRGRAPAIQIRRTSRPFVQLVQRYARLSAGGRLLQDPAAAGERATGYGDFFGTTSKHRS